MSAQPGQRAGEFVESLQDMRPGDGKVDKALRAVGANVDGPSEAPEPARIVTARAFADVDEPGAEPLVGSAGEVLVPEGGDVMFYGDGGASKTTLSIDLAVHLAAGDDWLGIPVPKPVRVLLIEAEGPRALFRHKLRRKLEAWNGSEIGDRLFVMETPWADFRFPDADEIAALVGEHEIDVLIAGPLSRIGMDELGTLQQVRDFTAHVSAFRTRAGRRLTVGLIHHENKGGTVSGAWEGAGDTLFHAQVHARGKTTLTVQKARWSGEWHKRTLELAWTDGEGFEVVEEEERHLEAEIARLLAERPHLTASEIAAPDGISAAPGSVRKVLENDPERFTSRTGEAAKAVGRHPTAKVWELVSEVDCRSNHLKPPGLPRGGDGEGELVVSPYREPPTPKSPPLHAQQTDSTAESPPAEFQDEGR